MRVRSVLPPSLIVESLGDRLSLTRVQAGLSQEDLAELVGCTKSTVSDVERGLSDPRASTLFGLADALGVSAEWLYRGEEGAA